MLLSVPQVPLGIFLKNENKLDEMVTILDDLHQYVPTVAMEKTVAHPVTGDNITVSSYCFHRLLLGGDQLMAARIRGAQNPGQFADRAW